MDAERIMERVRRLLAIANDPAASDNEQRIALEQAQRLMDRHAIEEWQRNSRPVPDMRNRTMVSRIPWSR